MRYYIFAFVLCLLLILPTQTFAYGHYNVSSSVPADVYIDNEYSATISATQTLKLILAGPKSYVIGVRAHSNGDTYKEAVNVGDDKNEHRNILAFPAVAEPESDITIYSNVPADVYVDNVHNKFIDSNHPLEINLPGPRTYTFEVRARASRMIYREDILINPAATVKKEIRAFEEVPVSSPDTEFVKTAEEPKGSISREEMADAIQDATAKAKAEALAEEAGRRERASKRAMTNKGIAHVVGVEANSGVSSSVKNMERIKLLLEAVPIFKK